MKHLILVVIITILCSAALMKILESELVTTQIVQATYISLHGGGK